VHENQMIQRFHDLVVDHPLAMSITIEPEVETGSPFGFKSEISRPHQPIMMTTQTRLRNLATADFKRMRGTNLPRNLSAGDLRRIDSTAMTPELVGRYLALSGDDNPLHTHDAYAQENGLERAIVPGMLMFGALENALEQFLPDQRPDLMRIRFLAPVIVDTKIGFCLQVKSAAQSSGRVRIFILTANDIVAAIADISLSPSDDSRRIKPGGH